MRRPHPLALAILALVATASAADASVVTHSGYLLDDADAPVSAPSQSFTFALFSGASGGSAFWTGTCTRPVAAGYYTAQLDDDTCGRRSPFRVPDRGTSA